MILESSAGRVKSDYPIFSLTKRSEETMVILGLV